MENLCFKVEPFISFPELGRHMLVDWYVCLPSTGPEPFLLFVFEFIIKL